MRTLLYQLPVYSSNLALSKLMRFELHAGNERSQVQTLLWRLNRTRKGERSNSPYLVFDSHSHEEDI